MATNHLKAYEINGTIAASQNTSTGETDLASAILPARSMERTGDGIHVMAWGIVANNTNDKTVTFYFGSATQAFVLQKSVATAWKLDVWLFSTGANSQEGIATFTHGVLAANTQDVFRLAFTQESTNDITVKTTGTGGATADILQKAMVVLT